jgi:hypothetical protein
MDIYIHSPIRFHGVVLNSLSAETTLLSPYGIRVGGDINLNKEAHVKRRAETNSWPAVSPGLTWLCMTCFRGSKMLHSKFYCELGVSRTQSVKCVPTRS